MTLGKTYNEIVAMMQNGTLPFVALAEESNSVLILCAWYEDAVECAVVFRSSEIRQYDSQLILLTVIRRSIMARVNSDI